MKNIEKKWTLFLIATFVTFFGIVNVIIKGTMATEVIANQSFDDINFYKCVVDAYNTYVNDGTDVDYTDSLTDEQLASIETLYCFGSEEVKIVSTKGLSKLTGLKDLRLSNNSIESIDLSQNKELTWLDLGFNDLKYLDLSNNEKLTVDTIIYDYEDFYTENVVYVGEELTIENSIIFPESIDIIWDVNSDSDGVEIADGVFSSTESGYITVWSHIGSKNGVTINHTVHVVDLTSEKYEINNVLNSIYFGVISDSEEANMETLLNRHISVSDSVIDDIANDIVFEFKDDGYYTLNIKYGNKLLKTFNIFGINFKNLEELTYLEIDGNVLKLSEVKDIYDFESIIETKRDDMEVRFYDSRDSLKETESSYLASGMILAVYYNIPNGAEESDGYDSHWLYTYDIVVDEYNFLETVDVDEESNIIFVPFGSKIEDIVNLSSLASVQVYDVDGVIKSDEDSLLSTGEKFEITLSNGINKVSYDIVSYGDVNGDGVIDTADLELVARQIIKGDVLTGVYVLAADMNKDGKITLSDIVKLFDTWMDIQS